MSVPSSVQRAVTMTVIGIAIGLLAVFAVIGVPQIVGATHSYVVLSGSMEPSISAGDVVIVDERPPEEISEGDVITFVDGSSPTTHKVIDVVQDGETIRFKTKGTANEDPDQGFVEADQVVGETMFTIPYLGRVVMLANTKLGAALFLIVPGVLLVLNEVWGLAQEWRHRDSSDTEVVTDGD